MVITLHLRSGNKISLEVPEDTAKEIVDKSTFTICNKGDVFCADINRVDGIEIEGGAKFKQMNEARNITEELKNKLDKLKEGD